ncbi:MAG TPA: riboflavin synthase [Planctomycetes bacterium]|nr:riboflavin synthase [Planctomycetota bacterium]
MFTGIVEGLCPVVAAEFGGQGLRLTVDLACAAEGVQVGDSIAVDGCCLTVTELEGTFASFHAARETLGLTTLATMESGRRVNIERALAFGDRLGGHLVSGHVDGLGEVVEVRAESSQTWMTFRLPDRLFAQTLLKGSIALDGVSLTITEKCDGHISVALIPHTLEVTTLGSKRKGDRVNVETDMMGKWIMERLGPVLEELETRMEGRGES